ncbi:methylated-DNA--[protein]-cysteine S-methyltransferase [Niabella drilacis]|uniref:O-6-methylguanine DNA methyltransferase n=1 Tax=Niabella drilacis (strain DSM 25811 / CCM 8410 / CCUG 62505 / LMG 26954 / E90) TaxID=1285928 RepID=A0A1G6XZY8_NIADE|nr:methylated-DNA--[protein]-cysteine S-methyltransferase [Niabella drilacis]SDD83774.1 O-6-methylguanine DNA methyltransferase [Niabella drilacis]
MKGLQGKKSFSDVRNKNTMRQRLAATEMIVPGNIQLEPWSPGDAATHITYECAGSPFGEILVAATSKGVCYLGFTGNEPAAALRDLKRRFPFNPVSEGRSFFQTAAIRQMHATHHLIPVRLHLKGTPFQLQIWKQLLRIPFGGLTTYARLGGSTRAARAAGHAVGCNPVGFLLPCHRVICTDGSFNRYFWGTELKEKLLTWEAETAQDPGFTAPRSGVVLNKN